MRRLQVLISAHELSPYQGSECAEGWNLVTRIAEHHDVTVLYAQGSQFEPHSYENAINDWNSKNKEITGLEFIAVSQPKFTLFLASINKSISSRKTGIGIPFLYYWGYDLWQKKAYRIAKRLKSYPSNLPLHLPLNLKTLSRNFDLAHHLTQITFRNPGYLWKLGLPFVWGPTGGLESVPASFARSRGMTVYAKEVVRKLINNTTFRFSLKIQQAMKRADLIYAFSRYDMERFGKGGAQRVELMLDAGAGVTGKTVSGIRYMVSGFRFPVSGGGFQVSGGDKLKIIWVGQLVERKALDILIDAVMGSEELIQNCHITIVGDGPLRTTIENRLFTLSPFSPFTLLGLVSHSEVQQLMSDADILVHTSYREATSNVIPEALSTGLPVICHDISGMSIAVNDTCGMKIPLVDKNTSITGFRNALLSLLPPTTRNPQPETGNPTPDTRNQEHLAQLKRGAINQAKNLSWDSMASEISQHYLEITQ